LIAAAHRGLSNAEAERDALEELAARDADATDCFLRVMEISRDRQDWESVARNARRMLAVNPLVPAPHRYLAEAAEKLGQRDDAIRSYRALLMFDTADAADVRFRLASLLSAGGEPERAKREVLLALEEAPRFVAAHRLLLQLTANHATANAKSDEATESEKEGR
jgi:tetratricopeptide (TPR) repeat protein